MAALKIFFMNISDPDKTKELYRVIVLKRFDNKQKKTRRSLLYLKEIGELNSTHLTTGYFG